MKARALCVLTVCGYLLSLAVDAAEKVECSDPCDGTACSNLAFKINKCEVVTMANTSELELSFVVTNNSGASIAIGPADFALLLMATPRDNRPTTPDAFGPPFPANMRNCKKVVLNSGESVTFPIRTGFPETWLKERMLAQLSLTKGCRCADKKTVELKGGK